MHHIKKVFIHTDIEILTFPALSHITQTGAWREQEGAEDEGSRFLYVINLCTVNEIKIHTFMTLSANSSDLN